MPVNTFREDEDQKQVVKRQTIIRLFRYMVQYQKQVAGGDPSHFLAESADH